MRFSLIDRITDIKPNESITAVKALTLAEEYLADHFPAFPVLPGVLMVEAIKRVGAPRGGLRERVAAPTARRCSR